MDDTREAGNETANQWNGASGHAWVDAQALLDRVFEPFERLLVNAVLAEPRRRVLDVGCGTGGITVAIARALGGTGRADGIDISEPMIAAAEARAERDGQAPAFIQADAESHAFEPAGYDMIVSRFGVMFFADSVRAFANLRRSARDGGELRFIAWRSPGENPFMTTAERAAAPLLPALPAREPNAPGQFAFADAVRVRRILDQSGWAEIDIRPIDTPCTFPETALLRYIARLGPVGRALDTVDEQTRARVVGVVRTAFEPFVDGADVRFTAACWEVAARCATTPSRTA